MAELRIGDADREATVGLLGEQYALGRLTKKEFDERSDATAGTSCVLVAVETGSYDVRRRTQMSGNRFCDRGRCS